MNDYKLIYFKGCPNHLLAVDLLNSIGLNFLSICQDDIESSNEFKNYSSPTLLRGEEIVFGAKAIGGSCSMPLPTKEELQGLVK